MRIKTKGLRNLKIDKQCESCEQVDEDARQLRRESLVKEISLQMKATFYSVSCRPITNRVNEGVGAATKKALVPK